MRKLLKKYATLIVIILVSSSCGTSPEKPTNIWDCRIIAAESVAFCINNTTLEEKDIPILSMDKYVAFSNEDWSRILIYIKLLERNVPGKYRQKIQNNIIDFHKTEDLHKNK